MPAVQYLGPDASDTDEIVTYDQLGLVPINTQTASYILALTDAGKLVEMNVGTANNLTVPPNSSVAFATGTTVLIGQYGAGLTTVVQGSGVTIRKDASWTLVMGGQYAMATLIKRGTNEWWLSGDLAPV